MGLQELGYTSWSFQEGVPQTLSPKAEAAGYCATYLLTFSNNATHQRRTDVAIGASAFCAQASDREKSPELQRALAHREADGDLNAEVPARCGSRRSSVLSRDDCALLCSGAEGDADDQPDGGPPLR